MTLRLAFGRPWHQTEGMLASIMRLLGLELTVPDLVPANGSVRSVVAKGAGPGASSTSPLIPIPVRSSRRN